MAPTGFRGMLILTSALAVIGMLVIGYREQTRPGPASGATVNARSSAAPVSTERVLSLAKENLSAQLREPESARFGETWEGSWRRATDGTQARVACGFVNARNGYGGMTGNRRFISAQRGMAMVEDSAADAYFDERWRETCHTHRVN